jgi:broad specificity phosphatase PhoE
VQEAWFMPGDLDARMPGGEGFRDIEARFVPFVRGLVEEAAERDVMLLVGHGGLFHAMLPLVLDNVDHALVAQHPMRNTAYILAERSAGSPAVSGATSQ